MAKKVNQPRTAPRGGTTTVTGSGLFRKTVYFSPEEWNAIRREAFEQNVAFTDIVRHAIRQQLGLEAPRRSG